MTQFNVVKKWGNWDSEKSAVVASFDSKQDAEQAAQQMKDAQQFPWSAFVVEVQS